MFNLISKIKYQYQDFKFNQKLFSLPVLVKYYFHSYFLQKKFITVKIKSAALLSNHIHIRCRNGIDRKVLFYVFFQNFHLTPSKYLNKKSPVIVDLGSNIGCTIIDFKLRFPESKVFGFEMDIDNYKLAIANCSNFSNVHLFNKAVWIKRGTISYNKNSQTDAYSIQTSGNKDNQEVDCLSITDIINENDIENVDFLKMDIEGAEVNIFKETDLSWLDKVLSLNIEFHNLSEVELEKYVQLLKTRGFIAWKSMQHWSSIEAIRAPVQ